MLGGGVHHRLAGGHRAGEGDVIDARVRHQRRAGGGAGAGDHVADTGRQAGLQQQFGQHQRRQRRLLGRLDDHRAACGQRRRQAARGGRDRVVPRHDLRGHADRLVDGVGDVVGAERDAVALVLVAGAGVVLEGARRAGHVAERFAQPLAGIERLGHGQALGMFADQGRAAVQHAAALRRAWRVARVRPAQRAPRARPRRRRRRRRPRTRRRPGRCPDPGSACARPRPAAIQRPSMKCLSGRPGSVPLASACCDQGVQGRAAAASCHSLHW